MRTPEELKRQAEIALERLKAGECIVSNDDTIDAMQEHFGDEPVLRTLTSARNRQQMGTLDQYIVWAVPSARPKNLVIDCKTMIVWADRPAKVVNFAGSLPPPVRAVK